MIMIGSVEHRVLGIIVESLGVSALLLKTGTCSASEHKSSQSPSSWGWCELTESNGAACPFVPTAAPVWLSAHTYTHCHSLAHVSSAVPAFLLRHTLVTFYASLLCPQTSGLWLHPTSAHYLQYTFLPLPQPHFLFLLIIYCLGVILLSFHSWTLSERFLHGKHSSWLWLFISIDFTFLPLPLVSYPLDNFDSIVSWTLNFWMLSFIWKWCL